jgi:hypothetical protein
VTAWADGLGTALIERLGWCLVHSVWEGAAVALVAAGVVRWLRRSSAQVRYLTACGALLAMTIMPLAPLISTSSRRDADIGPRTTLSQSASESNVVLDRAQSTLQSMTTFGQKLGRGHETTPSKPGRGSGRRKALQAHPALAAMSSASRSSVSRVSWQGTCRRSRVVSSKT